MDELDIKINKFYEDWSNKKVKLLDGIKDLVEKEVARRLAEGK